MLCYSAAGRTRAVEARQEPGGELRITPYAAGSETPKSDRARIPVIWLLPKSLYLTKTLELPRVMPHELPSMLRLELEATLPREFGAAEVAYCELAAGRGGRQQFEVYVARREELVRGLDELKAAHGRPAAALPASVLWRSVLRKRGGEGLLWVCWDPSHVEVASLSESGAVSVRTLRGPCEAGEDAARVLGRSLLECIRSLRPAAESPGASVPVAWLGEMAPPISAGARVVLEDLNAAPENPSAPGAALLRTLATEVQRVPIPDTANLLPRALLDAVARKAVTRHLTVAAVALVVSVALTVVALRVSTWRHDRHRLDVERRIAAIRHEGESIGQRLDQLAAVRHARGSQTLFQDVVGSLLNATPEGVTYSEVQVTPAGLLLIRGQATSSALPFLLPERLGREPLLESAMVKDLAQSKRVEGAMTEFRLECRLRREGTSPRS